MHKDFVFFVLLLSQVFSIEGRATKSLNTVISSGHLLNYTA